MWTAQIESIVKDDTNPRVVVVFTNGIHTRTETISLINLAEKGFRQQIQTMKDNFERTFTFIDSLTVDYDFTDAGLTAAEQAERDLAEKRFKLFSLKEDLSLGLISDADFATAQAEIIALTPGK